MSEAKFRCMCGNIHPVPEERARNGIGVAHWRCTDCRRRFVLTNGAPETWTPIYLDPGVRSIDVRETGPSVAGSSARNPTPPPAIEFACRCGERITAHSWMYGSTTVCGACRSTIFMVLKYSTKRRAHVIAPEFPAKV